MISVHDWLETDRPPARMIMQVHDELVFEVEAGAAASVRDAVVDLMSSAASLRVPLQVDTGTGLNWDEAH